ncbi:MULTISPECIES: hypothetical protein [Chryseobacterium]|uniref:hypothetical protein n=1 Tax=Chryseobacterium TaxID=59732 RepID=UPI00211F3AB7|nr:MULTISPECIES: hypothetical protein [Chryseobacterium]MCQ9634418.1 hypothetical protein [Chryseobacterium sp. WG23]MDC8102512.1 hypothetical protein [Chryseobacterium rhizosphaerae]
MKKHNKMVRIVNNMFFLIESLFKTTASLVAEDPLFNKDFMDKFSDPQDKEKLEKMVAQLKADNDNKPHKITLKNNKEVTIVVN